MLLRRSFLLFFTLFACILTGRAQQDPVFTQYMFSKVAFNPGAAGHAGGICINGLVRQQWGGFKDEDGNSIGQEDFLLTAHAPIRALHGAVSGVIMQDKIAFFSDINVSLGYTYLKDVGQGNLGIGFRVKFINRALDFSKLQFIDDGDPLNLNSEESDMLFDFSLGAYYEVPDNYYFGISSVDILQSGGKNLVDDGSFKLNTDRGIYLTGGYNFVLPNNPSFEIKPSALLLKAPGVINYNISSLVEYNNKFWGGLNYKNNRYDFLGIIVGVHFKKFDIGYSYDIALGKYGLGGIHEIRLGYCFKLELERAIKIYRNTRFL